MLGEAIHLAPERTTTQALEHPTTREIELEHIVPPE